MNLFKRLLRHNKHDAVVDHLTYVLCPQCKHRFFGVDELDAALKLSAHSVVLHDEPPTPDEPSFDAADYSRRLGY